MKQSRELSTAIQAARLAGEAIKAVRNNHTTNTRDKADGSQVTEGDFAAQKAIIATIRNNFPTHSILSEELTEAEQTLAAQGEHLWIIDPIDGTTNYAYGMRQVGISIAYARTGVVYAGVVFNPFNDELFAADKGNGAWLNDNQIKIGAKNVTTLDTALISTGFPPLPQGREAEITRICKVLRTCRDVRRAGACSLDMCDVACGRIDAYYETVKSWDMAAGGLIAREAGAILINFQTGKPTETDGENILLARPELIEPMRKLLGARGGLVSA